MGEWYRHMICKSCGSDFKVLAGSDNRCPDCRSPQTTPIEEGTEPLPRRARTAFDTLLDRIEQDAGGQR